MTETVRSRGVKKKSSINNYKKSTLNMRIYKEKNIKEMEKVMFTGKSVALHIHIMRSLKSTIIFNLENQSEKNH